MTTQKEQAENCPFCNCPMHVESNRDWHKLKGDHSDICFFDALDDTRLTVPAKDEQLSALIRDWNTRAAARPSQAAAVYAASKQGSVFAGSACETSDDSRRGDAEMITVNVLASDLEIVLRWLTDFEEQHAPHPASPFALAANNLRAALSQPRPVEPVAWQLCEHGLDVWSDIPNELFGINPQRFKYRELYAAPQPGADVLKDAQRYRWLRDHGFQFADVSLGNFDGDDFVNYRMSFNLPEPAHQKYEDDEWAAADIAAAIDFALAKREGGGDENR